MTRSGLRSASGDGRGVAVTDDLERERMDGLRRALRDTIAQMQDARGLYAFDLRVVATERSEQTTL